MRNWKRPVIFHFLLWIFISILQRNDLAEAQPTYTEQENAAIVKFRGSVKNDLYKDYMKSDTYLIRWLKAKNFNENEAQEMLLKALKWRKERNIDAIVDEKVIQDAKLQPFYYLDGTDYEGSIVGVAFASRLDIRRLIVAGKRDTAVRAFEQLIERIEEGIMMRIGALGTNNNKTMGGAKTHVLVEIIDLGGYNLRQHACVTCKIKMNKIPDTWLLPFCFGVYFEWFDILRLYYPGYLKHLFFINTPRIFIPLLKLIKPLMDKNTRDVLRVFGPNKTEWIEVISKIVPANQLRAEIGGLKSV